MRRIAKIIAVICCILCLSGCLWWDSKPMGVNSPEALYQRGYQDYQKKKYKRAIESFQRLKEEYPLSTYALMAEMGIADSYFSDEDYAAAEVCYQDFMELHPTNENLPYVAYQIGMCHYNQVLSIDRDQTETRNAKEAFERLTVRFPDSKFTFMAEKKLRECLKKLGEHEFYVGFTYFKLKKYKAALMRFEGINEHYRDLGLDYKVKYFIAETEKRLAEETKIN